MLSGFDIFNTVAQKLNGFENILNIYESCKLISQQTIPININGLLGYVQNYKVSFYFENQTE